MIRYRFIRPYAPLTLVRGIVRMVGTRHGLAAVETERGHFAIVQPLGRPLEVGVVLEGELGVHGHRCLLALPERAPIDVVVHASGIDTAHARVYLRGGCPPLSDVQAEFGLDRGRRALPC